MPWPSIARTPPTVRSPGAGCAINPRSAPWRNASRSSIVAPVCVTTAGGPPPERRIAVRCRVVSTSTTRGERDGVPASASGDQVCPRPSARTRYPCRHAQLTTPTTSAGVRGAHVQTPSTSIACAQLTNRRRATSTPRGKPRGRAAAAVADAGSAAAPASAAPAATKPRRDSRSSSGAEVTLSPSGPVPRSAPSAQGTRCAAAHTPTVMGTIVLIALSRPGPSWDLAGRSWSVSLYLPAFNGRRVLSLVCPRR